jgi:hypothetical protein
MVMLGVYTSMEGCWMSGCAMLTAFCKGSEDTGTCLPPTVHVHVHIVCEGGRDDGREGRRQGRRVVNAQVGRKAAQVQVAHTRVRPFLDQGGDVHLLEVLFDCCVRLRGPAHCPAAGVLGCL